LLWKTKSLTGMSERAMKSAINDEMNMSGNKSVQSDA
jgi:hypothetical protein